jgi:hypothetical protein
MPFVVRADSSKPGEGSFRADKVTRFAALETALSHQYANNTQIAAPQRTTNQTNESQTSTSSSFMVGSAR